MDSKLNQEYINTLVNRLENAVRKLEVVDSSASGENSRNISSVMLSTENIAVFTDFWNKTIQNLLGLKKLAEETKKPETEKLTELIIEGLCFQQDILIAGLSFKKPQANNLQEISKKLFAIMGKAEEIKKEQKDFALHCDAVKSGLESLTWLFNDDSCDAYVQTYAEMIEFPANKLFMQKIPEQTAWIKALKAIFKDVIELVKANYKKGINWSLKGDDDINNLMLSIGNTYRKNFKKQNEENKNKEHPKVVQKHEEDKKEIANKILSGEFKKSLKPVQKNYEDDKSKKPEIKEQKTEEVKPPQENKVAVNNTNNTNNANASTSTNNANANTENTRILNIKKKLDAVRGIRENMLKKGPSEKYEQMRCSYYYENIIDEVKELDEEKLQIKTIVNFTNCYNCTFSIKKKVNAIKLTNCENVNIICDSLISIMEIINSENLKIQVDGVINSFSVDGSKEISFYLLPNSAHAGFIVSKSIDLRLRLRREEDPSDFDEVIIPEQFVFNLNDSRKMNCKISDLYH
jgi:hypothetical protein